MVKLFYLGLYGLPLIGLTSVLFKLLKKQIACLKNIEDKTANNRITIIKILFIVLGIIYTSFCYAGLALYFFPQSWFQPPKWLILTFIISIVPYFACLFGFLFLGQMGHGGVSPSRVIKAAYDDISKEDQEGK